MAGTNQNYTLGIAHLGRKMGGEPACKNRRAHIVVTEQEFEKTGYGQCKRCAAILAKRKAKHHPTLSCDDPSESDDLTDSSFTITDLGLSYLIQVEAA